ncbi:hypothetical protein C7447_103132 [Tenacibaculum adriaticum]|uniref:Uncharacterized protein n=1 Tax=Tenacibaculum adriaticum TaxID=413713 RepID=A0A5S5DSH3_9FLAO|nr:hypothetical protein C7447_103132 [Tenacibaculum adriaticum]
MVDVYIIKYGNDYSGRNLSVLIIFVVGGILIYGLKLKTKKPFKI